MSKADGGGAKHRTPPEAKAAYGERGTTGYCSPPKEKQFKKGGQGGPGRPPRKDFYEDKSTFVLDFEIANMPTEVMINGKRKTVATIEALRLAERKRALEGDTKAAAAILERHDRASAAYTKDRNDARRRIEEFLIDCKTARKTEIDDPYLHDAIMETSRWLGPEKHLEVVEAILGRMEYDREKREREERIRARSQG